MDELQVRRLFHIVISFQNGKAIAVGQCVDFLSGSAQRAIRHKACHIAGDVLGGEDAHHRHLVHLYNRAEYCGDPLQASTEYSMHSIARRAVLPEFTVEIRSSTFLPETMPVRLSRKMSWPLESYSGVTT